MTLSDDIKSEIGNILRTRWATREGAKIPEASDVELGNDAVTLDGTVLYADLAESTSLVNRYKDWFAAEIYKCYLRGACRAIQNNGGTITAFDGDRVMAVFIGNSKNTQAVGSALEINYVTSRIINPMVKEAYPKEDFEVRQAVGIDTSRLFIARTGVRGSNDLVWVGRASNYAAKLATFRDGPFASWITADIHDHMANSVKFSKGDEGGERMWEERPWVAQSIKVYRSNWLRTP